MIKKRFWELLLIFWIFWVVEGTGFGQEKAGPWVWWFWPGAAVTETGIRSQMISFQHSGFSGASINSIYAANDLQHPPIPFMSDKWIGMIRFTLRIADSLGMQVDLSPVSGWPFGGPSVKPADAAKKILGTIIGPIHGNTDIEKKILSPDTARLLSLTAVQSNDKAGSNLDQPTDPISHIAIQLLAQTDSAGVLRTKLPGGEWKLYALYLKPTSQKVKRAGPGGEGLVLDPFSKPAVEHYLDGLSEAMKPFSELKLHAVFNDSYEVYGADGTPDILNEFRTRRGYALEDFSDIFLGPADNPARLRILADYRQTFAELLNEKLLGTWNAHSHSLGLKTREQAHGAPGNLLDLYAAADIPETESFGSSAFKIPGVVTDPDYSPTTFGRPDPLVMKFATSAANVSGKNIVSSESATWLANHFKVSLAQVKPQIDELFAAGVNQVMLASASYSPADVPWPGWVFYASTDFGPNTSFYNYLPDFSKYVSTCQEILRESTPDNDLLIYFPFSEVISKIGKDMGNLVTFEVHYPGKWLYAFAYGKLARELFDKGISFDFISDDQLKALSPHSKKPILIPDCRFMPVETARAINRLADSGATVIYQNQQPADVPGFFRVQERLKELTTINKSILATGKKVSIVNADIPLALQKAGVKSEPFGTHGLRYIRKVKGSETIYFVTNLASEFHEAWLKPATNGRNVIFFDPLTHKSSSMPRDTKGGIFLQLEPGQSCFITINDSNSKANKQNKTSNLAVSGTNEISIPGPWNLSFSGGGPVVPSPVIAATLGSWTQLADTLCRWYSGTGTYETDFTLPIRIVTGATYTMNLGDVREAAEVWINGHPLGRAWCVPFRLNIDPAYLNKGTNHLKIAVTNHAVNRIIWQDKNRVPWKNYFFVDILYKDFNAAKWLPVESGLLGPVTIR